MIKWLLNLFRARSYLCLITVTPAVGVKLHFAGEGATRHEVYRAAMQRRGGLEPVTNVRYIKNKE